MAALPELHHCDHSQRQRLDHGGTRAMVCLRPGADSPKGVVPAYHPLMNRRAKEDFFLCSPAFRHQLPKKLHKNWTKRESARNRTNLEPVKGSKTKKKILVDLGAFDSKFAVGLAREVTLCGRTRSQRVLRWLLRFQGFALHLVKATVFSCQDWPVLFGNQTFDQFAIIL